MPIAADFRVINALAHKLEAEKPLSYTFAVPSHLARGGDQPQSVILIKYFLEGASALTWELHLNGSRLLQNSGSGSHLLMTMEAFDSNLLLPGENRVDIRLTHGLGTIRIADMVIHFHVSLWRSR
jgi:hypothetical protein